MTAFEKFEKFDNVLSFEDTAVEDDRIQRFYAGVTDLLNEFIEEGAKRSLGAVKADAVLWVTNADSDDEVCCEDCAYETATTGIVYRGVDGLSYKCRFPAHVDYLMNEAK